MYSGQRTYTSTICFRIGLHPRLNSHCQSFYFYFFFIFYEFSFPNFLIINHFQARNKTKARGQYFSFWVFYSTMLLFRYLNARKYDGGFNKEEVNTIFNTIRKNFSAWVRAFAPVAIGVNNSHAIAEFETSLGRMKPEIALGIAKTVFLSDLRRVLPQVHVPSTIIQSKKDVIVPEFIACYLKKKLAWRAC